MKPILFSLVVGIVFTIVPQICFTQQSPIFVGAGVTYTAPQTDAFSEANESSFGGTVFLGTRKYCSLWAGVRLDYTQWQKKTENTMLYYEEMITISPEFRYFPAQAHEFPLYLQGLLSFNSTSGTDQLNTLGLGGGAGIGFIVPYENNCTPWFFDINARYMAPNFILKTDNRPVLNHLNVSLTFNLGL